MFWNIKTKYYGITVGHDTDTGEWWLMESLYGSDHYMNGRPTDQQIDQYAGKLRAYADKHGI